MQPNKSEYDLWRAILEKPFNIKLMTEKIQAGIDVNFRNDLVKQFLTMLFELV